MTTPIRVTVVMTHPVQYFSPWFRHIAATCPEVDLTVLYGAIPGPEQQGVGFDRAFTWDVPLTAGHRVVVCGEATGKSFASEDFFGIDVPDIEQRLLATAPDVVLVPGWHSALQLRAIRACRKHRIPLLYRGDSTLFSGPRRAIRPLWRLKTRYMLRQFDGYLAVGAFADEYLRAFGIPDPLIARSPHCVDNDRFAAAADPYRTGEVRARARAALGIEAGDFVVLCAGKFQSRKRPLDAVRAVAPLGPGSVLMMAGDGPLAGAAREEAERLGVRLVWRGFLNQSELPAAFAVSDAVIVPSAWESWGLVVNEALASGVPCVVTKRVACAPDLVVDGVTGFAVEPGDIAAMTGRLGEIRRARQNGHDYAAACRQRANACSFAAATDGLRVLARRVSERRIQPAMRKAPVRVIACCGGMVSVFGAERMTFEILRVLREHGAATHCLLNSWGSSQVVPFVEQAGATWSPGHYLAPVRRRGLTLPAALRLAWDVARTSAVLWRDARALRATHILAPDFLAVLRNAPALALLRLSGTAVVMKVGNAPEASPFYARLWRWGIAPLVDSFIANSQFTAAALHEVGVSPRTVAIVANAAPIRPVAGEPEPFDPHRVIYVGQIIPPKGPDLLLDAASVLVRRGIDVRLDLVGDIDGWESPAWAGYQAGLRARAAAPDLAGRVRFLGRREDVPALLAGAAVHCAPSRPEIREAFGVVVVEAKEAGVPSVVTPSGGLPELIEHRQDGWICADATADAVADGLEFFLSDPSRRDEAAAAARRSAHRLSRARFAQSWLAVFGLASAPLSTARTVERHAH